MTSAAVADTDSAKPTSTASSGAAIISAITLAAFTFWLGASWQFRYALLAALATSLAITQFLAHGMTSPLRQMTAANA